MDETAVKEITGALLTKLHLAFTEIRITKDADMLRVDIVAPDASRIIGWHGETLNAIQHLIKSIVRQRENLTRAPFIVLDVDGYRRMQEEKVCTVAEQKADFVRRTGNRIALAPMSPYFRRVVHLHVANTPTLQDLTTESVGEGDYRQIVLKMKEEKESAEGELSPVISEGDGLENLDV